MVTVTLDDRDRAVLKRLSQGDADVESLAESESCEPSYLRSRLPELADNGLVEQVDDDVYALTANGKRAIVASPAGTMDDRIDTPTDVERAIESFDLRPDREEAVRNAFSFLHYWGTASEGEIVDGVYSENPAGFESSAEWWTECVRDRLEALPSVEPPASPGGQWRYGGTPVVEEHTDDGRAPLENDVKSRSSVKFALEQLALTEDERSAVRAAFDPLVREGTVSRTEVEDEVYPVHDAGYGTASEWWNDCVRPAFESLPGVEGSEGTRDRWQYRQSVEGPMSSAPGADVSDESLDSDDENAG